MSDDNWKELFLSFCKEGCGTEARLLWNRYNCVLKPWMQDSFAAFSSFVDILTSSINGKSGSFFTFSLPSSFYTYEESQVQEIVVSGLTLGVNAGFFGRV